VAGSSAATSGIARANGYILQSPDANQAQGSSARYSGDDVPRCGLHRFRLQTAPYRFLFEEIWLKVRLDIKFPHDTEQICDTPAGAAVFGTNVTPIKLKARGPGHGHRVFQSLGAGAFLLRSLTKSQCFLVEIRRLPRREGHAQSNEMAGYNLFKGKANCNSCHLDGRSTDGTDPGIRDRADRHGTPGRQQTRGRCSPAYGYSNLGLPLNPQRCFLLPNHARFLRVYRESIRLRLQGLGLGTFLRSGFGSGTIRISAWTPFGGQFTDGQMQPSTARDVALGAAAVSHDEAPGPYFHKEFLSTMAMPRA